MEVRGASGLNTTGGGHVLFFQPLFFWPYTEFSVAV